MTSGKKMSWIEKYLFSKCYACEYVDRNIEWLILSVNIYELGNQIQRAKRTHLR